MSDPVPLDAPGASGLAATRDRDARVEQLLLQGLDHYFESQYEQAINVWTRVLFIDRGHARARAYIERARSALAERQRQSEELLHRGVAAFERGDVDRARRWFSDAVAEGVQPELALSYLGRLDRLGLGGAPAEGALPVARSVRPHRARASARPVRLWRPHWRAAALGVVSLAVALGMTWFIAGQFGETVSETSRAKSSVLPPVEDPLPVPRGAELALDRAERLYAGGHAREALAVLSRVPASDPLRADADRLTAEIQGLLLGTVDGTAAEGVRRR